MRQPHLMTRLLPRPGAGRLLAALTACAGALAALPGSARAEEILARDAESCELVTIKCAEVLPETWTEVEYRERDRGPTKKVPLALVVEIRRTSGAQERSNLENAVQELERGNLTEARTALRDLAGGGYSMQEGARVFTSFMPKGASPTKGKRPAWTKEYAHFFYAKALVLEGRKTGNERLLEEALMCLDDVPCSPPDAKEKETSGGFLVRFKGGNSRWYADALLLRAQALAGLKRYDESLKAYEELFNQAVGVGLPPVHVYEAKVGPGEVAEAQGDAAKAAQVYEQAPTALETLLGQAQNRCTRLELGRYFSRIRARAAALKLKNAEASGSPAAYVPVKAFLLDSLPDALQKRFAGRPAEQLEAVMTGARAPEVQAVVQLGLGQAYLAESKFDEAILALRSVAVRYFGAREHAAAALYFLAKAADGAEKAAKSPGAKATYAGLKDDALKQLKADYADSPYATR